MNDELRPRAFLITERLKLRPLVEADIDGPYLDWFNDPEVCRFNGHFVYPYTRAKAIDYVKSLESKPDLVLAVTWKADGVHIGNVSLQEVDLVSRCAEFAIVLGDKSAWGRGVGFEAGRSVLEHGFRAMNLHRIAAGTSAANEPMCKLARQLGMKEEGVRRAALFKDGQYHDVIEFGLIVDEYQGAAEPGG